VAESTSLVKRAPELRRCPPLQTDYYYFLVVGIVPRETLGAMPILKSGVIIMNQAMKITMSGKEGMFQTEKYVYFHKQHETTLSMVDNYKGLRKELGKMLKQGDVQIDIIESTDYNHNSKVRLIVCAWDIRVEYRPITPQKDFSDITTYKFTSQKAQFDYVIKTLQSFGLEILGELPEETSLFTESLRK